MHNASAKQDSELNYNQNHDCIGLAISWQYPDVHHWLVNDAIRISAAGAGTCLISSAKGQKMT